MADIFSGRTIVSGREGVEGIANSIDIIEELPNLAAPRFCAGERVVRHEIQAVGDVALKMQRQGVIAGTIVGAKNGNIWKIVAAVAVHAGLESVVRAQNPVGAECVLSASGGVQRVGRVVIRIDQRRRAGSVLDIEIIYGVEGLDPSVLREIVEIQTNAGAQNGISGRAGSVSQAQTRGEGFAVVVRDAGDNSIACESGIQGLVVAGSEKKGERGVVAQAVVDGQTRSDAPGILGVDSQTLNVLRKAAVTGGSCGAPDTGRDGRSTRGAEIKGGRIGGVEAGVIRISQYRFGGSGEGAAENRLVNKTDAKARRVPAVVVAHVVAELIFFLVAQNGKSGNGSDELIVAKGLEPGDGAARGSEREIHRETKMRITRSGQMESADIEDKRANPVGIKSELVADNQVEVIAV